MRARDLVLPSGRPEGVVVTTQLGARLLGEVEAVLQQERSGPR